MAGIEDKLGTAARFDVFAAGPVTGFAAGLACHDRFFIVKTPVRAGGKFADDLHVAILAGGVSHIMGVWNRWRSDHRARFGGAGNNQQRHAGGQASRE